MEKSNRAEMEFQLKKLIMRYSDLFVYHQWLSEHKRWIELIFALLTRISKKPENEIRNAVEGLDELDLLGVEALAEIPETNVGIDLNVPHAKRILEHLSESGYPEKESKNGILIMHEAAKSLMKHHDGKIQKYLRVYGQRMIDELRQNFSFSKMNPEDVRYAFTYWLQNVLNMPLSLKTEGIKKFSKEFQITDEELLKEADNLDINLALLDDVIDQHIRNMEKGG